MKTFEYSPLGKELKAQTNIAKKQYQKLNNTFEFDKIIEKENPTLENCSKSNLIYNANHIFYNAKNFFLIKYFKDLNKFNNLKPQKEKTKNKKTNASYTASELNNKLIETYSDKYNELSDAKMNRMDPKYDPESLIMTYGFKMKN